MQFKFVYFTYTLQLHVANNSHSNSNYFSRQQKAFRRFEES